MCKLYLLSVVNVFVYIYTLLVILSVGSLDHLEQLAQIWWKAAPLLHRFHLAARQQILVTYSVCYRETRLVILSCILACCSISSYLVCCCINIFYILIIAVVFCNSIIHKRLTVIK